MQEISDAIAHEKKRIVCMSNRTTYHHKQKNRSVQTARIGPQYCVHVSEIVTKLNVTCNRRTLIGYRSHDQHL